MANEFQELLKGQNILGGIGEMRATATSKTLYMFFIVDISGSMIGERINKVNDAFRDMIPALCDLQRSVNDAFELRIAILGFGSEPKWLVEPIPVLDYVHVNIKADGGGTNYTKAFVELETKMCKSAFMNCRGKIAEPYIMFMTDGEPFDKGYDKVLRKNEDNLYYSHSKRYAVLIGSEAISNQKARSAVEAFVSDPENGIITAAEATDIVAAVSANTIHTIKGMTIHNAGGGEVYKNGTGFGGQGGIGDDDSDNPFGKDWQFDASDVYGGNFTF